MKCPHCDATNPADSAVCRNCARPLLSKETMVASSVTHGIDVNEFEPETIFAGRYKLIEKLGAGGMGVVYKAEDLKLKRLVALKFLSRHLTSHGQAKQRFVQEARVASSLDHQNICTVYEIDETSDGQMYIAMIFYDGETLKKKIERGPLPVEEAAEIVRQIAQGLSSAHSQGVIHRDIKPANVIVTKDGIAKIVDFGLAKMADQTRLTSTTAVVGTAAYMSPEQAKAENVDRRTDIWSLGVVFYELLTGKPPFPGENNQAVLFSIVHKSPDPPTGLNKDIPEEVERIIFKCLRKNLDDRYESADRLLSDLTRLMAVFESRKGQERIEGAHKPDISKETELRQATVMFIEIAGTSKIMGHVDSEKVAIYLERCFVMFDSIIRKYGGGIDRITGSNFKALFGAPQAIENAPQKAVSAAIELRNSLSQLNREEGLEIPLDLRIGINTGSVIAGAMGVNGRKEYSVIGEALTLASRLMEISEKGQIYAGPATYRLSKDEFEYQLLKPISIEGMEHSVPVFRLLSVRDKGYRPSWGSQRRIFSEMVGRDRELSKLELHLLKAVNNEGSIVNIIGEAGIGKSRLISEFKRKDAVKKVLLLEGRALSISKNLSFHTIIDIIKNWVAIKDDDSKKETMGKLERTIQEIYPEGVEEVFPFIATLMGMKLSGKYEERVRGIEGEALERLILKSLRELIVKAAERKPLVLVIEDLHWADRSSLNLLESLFRLAEDHSILFINVFRPGDETGERLQRLIKSRYENFSTEIVLECLDENESNILIERLLKIKNLPGSIKALVIKRAEGNPFFIEEVIRSFIDDGVVEVRDGGFRISKKIGQVVIPETINELLMARIDKLDEDTKSLLKVASVIGRNFFYKILREVGKSIQEIDDKLGYLKETELIKEQIRMEEIEYLFKHALAQEAVYNSILMKKRKELHLKVGRSIESVFQERLHEFYGMLAFHFSMGEDLDKAEEYLIKSGEEALKSSASSEALHYYQEALRIYLAKHGRKADPGKVAMLEKNIALAFFYKGQYHEAVEYFDKTLAYLGEKLPKSRIAYFMKFLLGLLNFLKCLYWPGLVRVRTPTAEDREIISLNEKKSRALGISDSKRMFFETFIWIKKLTHYDLEDVESGGGLFAMVSVLFCYPGISLRLSRKVLEVAQKKVSKWDSRSLLFFKLAQLMYCYFAGDWDAVGEFDENLQNMNTRIGETWNTSIYLAFQSFLHIERGFLSLAQECEEKLLKISNTFEDEFSRLTKYLIKAKSLFKFRRLSESLQEAEKGIPISDKLGYEGYSLSLIAYQARIHLFMGNRREAERLLQKGEKIIKESNPVPDDMSQYSLSRFSLEIDRVKEAMRDKRVKHYKTLHRTAGQAGRKAILFAKKVPADLPEAERLMGVNFWIQGRQQKALKCWARSIEEAEKRGARLELSRTYFEVGKSLQPRGSRYNELNGTNAKEYLDKARRLFCELDLSWDLSELEKTIKNHELDVGEVFG